MKAVVAAFNQEKALVGAFSLIVQLHRFIDLRHYLISNDGANLHIIGCARCGGGVAPDTSWHNWPALLTALGHALPSSAHFSHLQTRQSRNAAQAGNRCVTEDIHWDQLLTFCSRFGFLDL